MSNELEALIVVKAYPNPSETLTEAACILGVSRELGFVRIYPIPFRDLEDEVKFAKYERVRMQVRAPRNDPRPNTFRPQIDSIEIVEPPLSTVNNWALRKKWVMPLLDQSMCQIMREQQATKRSMGFFKPAEVLDVTQSPDDPAWSTEALAKLERRDLFLTKEKKLLEKLPFKWRYRYRCTDPGCNGHHQEIIDWEIGALYRTLKRRGVTDPEEIHQAIRQKFLYEMCAADRDVYFYTGNMIAHPGSFLILGVFWPKIENERQMRLL